MAFPNRLLLQAILALVVPSAAVLGATPSGSCHIQSQALVCQYVNSNDTELVIDQLSKIASEHANFGLAFYNSRLEDFPEDLFQDYNITTFAHVADKRQLTAFPIVGLLMSLRSRVTHLYLVASAVHAADLEQLKALPFRESLGFLDLRYNALDAIEADNFAQFPNLEELNLLGNNITRVPQHSFRGLGRLQRLTLSQNAVAELAEEAFKGLFSLTHLDLAQSGLFSVPKNAFVNLESLQSLDLSMNKLTSLEKGVFSEQNLHKLTELKLGTNPFFCHCDLQWLKLWLTEKGLLTSSGAICFNERFKKFAQVDFCPDLDDDELVEEVTLPSDKKQDSEDDEDEEDLEAEEDEEDFETDEDEEDSYAEEYNDDWTFKEEL